MSAQHLSSHQSTPLCQRAPSTLRSRPLSHELTIFSSHSKWRACYQSPKATPVRSPGCPQPRQARPSHLLCSTLSLPFHRTYPYPQPRASLIPQATHESPLVRRFLFHRFLTQRRFPRLPLALNSYQTQVRSSGAPRSAPRVLLLCPLNPQPSTIDSHRSYTNILLFVYHFCSFHLSYALGTSYHYFSIRNFYLCTIHTRLNEK